MSDYKNLENELTDMSFFLGRKIKSGIKSAYWLEDIKGFIDDALERVEKLNKKITRDKK